MKKMNNKGFAITTLLYGLMSVGFLVMTLLMGIMSQNRQNTSTLVKKIEEELNKRDEMPIAVYLTSPDYLGGMMDVEAIGDGEFPILIEASTLMWENIN